MHRRRTARTSALTTEPHLSHVLASQEYGHEAFLTVALALARSFQREDGVVILCMSKKFLFGQHAEWGNLGRLDLGVMHLSINRVH